MSKDVTNIQGPGLRWKMTYSKLNVRSTKFFTKSKFFHFSVVHLIQLCNFPFGSRNFELASHEVRIFLDWSILWSLIRNSVISLNCHHRFIWLFISYWWANDARIRKSLEKPFPTWRRPVRFKVGMPLAKSPPSAACGDMEDVVLELEYGRVRPGPEPDDSDASDDEADGPAAPNKLQKNRMQINHVNKQACEV